MAAPHRSYTFQHRTRRGILLLGVLCAVILVGVKFQLIFADDVPPTLQFSTYLGGTGYVEAEDVAVDPQGNIYVVGHTMINTFPATNPFNLNLPDGTDLIYVMKFNPTTTTVLYSVFLGVGIGNAIAVDADGYAYVTGEARGVIPIQNAIQSSLQGSADAFVIRLYPSGQAAVFSTYLGGSDGDVAQGIDLDVSNNVYITGATASTDFPTHSAVQSTIAGAADAIIAKLTPSGALVYSTYYGGSNLDNSNDIAVDQVGNAYITGFTFSNDWPTVNPYQAAHASPCASQCWDAFVTKFDPSGVPVYSSYLGGDSSSGAFEGGIGVAVDAAGSLYVTGETSSYNFPTKNPYQANNTATYDAAFLTKFTPDGSALVYSTYLSGTDCDNWGSELSVDLNGKVYVAGATCSADFQTVNPIQAALGGTSNFFDAFLTQFSADGQSLLFSTYLGGSDDDGYGGMSMAYDPTGSVILAGVTESTDFPLKYPYQSNGGGAVRTAFLAKITIAAIPTTSPGAEAARNYYTTDRPTLTWTRITWATQYHVQVSKNNLFTGTPAFEGNTITNELSIMTDALDDGLYYWRVQAKNANDDWGNFGPTESFVIYANG